MDVSSNARQIVSIDSSYERQGGMAKQISAVFGFVPDSSTSSLWLSLQKKDYFRNLLLDNQLNKAPGLPGFIKELLSCKNRLYLWSNVSKFPKDLSVPEDISIHIFTADIVKEFRFEDICGMVIHRSPNSGELSLPLKKFLAFLFQEGLKNLKALVFLNVFLECEWLTESMYLCKLDLLCLENCVFANKEFLEKFVSVDKLYLTPSECNAKSIGLPKLLNHLEIFCPKSEKTDLDTYFSILARDCQTLETA
jgi:hypothetical protein